MDKVFRHSEGPELSVPCPDSFPLGPVDRTNAPPVPSVGFPHQSYHIGLYKVVYPASEILPYSNFTGLVADGALSKVLLSEWC